MNIYQVRKKYVAVLLLVIMFIISSFVLGCSSEKTNKSAPVVTETMEQFKVQCSQLDYKQLARNPESFKDRRIVYIGKVVQTQESGNNMALRINVTKQSMGLWEDTIWVNYTRASGSNRILENDIVQLWGTIKGLRQYKAVMGNEISIPEIDAKYLELYNEPTAVPVNTTDTKPQSKVSENFIDPKPYGDTTGAWSQVRNSSDRLLRIWNPKPVSGEKVEWFGDKIRHQDLVGNDQVTAFPIFYAHGNGKAVWYDKNGDFEQSDEGNFYGGKRHGKITQTFADGRVIASEWNYGIKVQ